MHVLQSWLRVTSNPCPNDEHGLAGNSEARRPRRKAVRFFSFGYKQLGLLSSDDERASPSTLVPGSVLGSDQAKPDTPMTGTSDGRLASAKFRRRSSDDGNTSVVDKADARVGVGARTMNRSLTRLPTTNGSRLASSGAAGRRTRPTTSRSRRRRRRRPVPSRNRLTTRRVNEALR